jgi:uncharacterized repeat protein (TIGR01451 family)
VPASDWLYGLPPVVDEGVVVAFMLNDVTESGGDHGTLCAGTALGQGNIYNMPYAGSYGSPYWPPTWYTPAPWPAGDGGISQGPARDTWLVAMGNYYAGGSSLNNYDFTALGYDGLPAGDPLDNNDQPHIYTNSYGSGSVENDGWNLASRYVSLMNRGYVAQQGLALPGDGEFSPLFVGSTGNSGFGYGTVTSPQPETAVMAGVETVFGQFNLGDAALFRDWVNWGHLGGFSDRGPTSMSTLGVHTLANGFFGSGNVPLNLLYGGDWSVDFWAGTSRSGPEAGGILALIYDAFWQAHGRYPTWYEARNLLMNGNRTAYNDPLAGPGLANALNAVEIVAGLRGVQVSSSEGDGFWIPGSYRGTEFPGFARGLFSGESDTETFTVTNYGGTPITATMESVTLEMYDSRDWNFTTQPLAVEGPGSRYYGRRLYGPPGSNPGFAAADPFFDATDPTDQALLADADVMVVRLSWPEEQFQEDPGSNWWFVYAAAWRDVDIADGTWFTDTNANGVMNSGEFQDEWVRINYDYHGNTAEIRVREPMKLINGIVGPNEPPMAPMDDILIMPRHFYYGGFDTTDLKITVELYHEVDWTELSFSTDALVVPAAGAETFDVTAGTLLVANTFFSEDFEGTFPPAGWQVFTNTVGGAWDRNDVLGQVNRVTNYGSGFTAASGTDGSSGTAWDTELWSPPIDLTGAGDVLLRFASNFQDYAGNGDAYLDISTDAGANWTNLDSWTSDDPGGTGGGGVERSADLSAYAGQTIHLRWHYVADSGLDWFWQIDNVLVQEATIEPPGEYTGYIKLTYADPYTYSEYIPVEKQIWFPADIDPILGGVDQPYLYDNGVMFGARGPSATGERAESGDWRFFFTDVDGAPPAGTYFLAHTYWQSTGTPPWATDIDTLFYGPVPNDPLFAGMEPILGPHGLEVIGGSLRAGSAPDWEYNTSSGGPSDWTAVPMVDEGLYGVAAQVVRWGGESTRVPYTITVGTVQATPEVVMEGLTCLSCTVPLTFKTNHEDLAGVELEAVGYGFNQPVHETLPVAQSQSTYYTYTITADDAYKLQINTSNPDPSVDVDLSVYLDGQLVGSSGRSDSNEQVIITFPAAGEYQIELYGYSVPSGVAPTDLDVVEISGAGAMTVGNLPISVELGIEYDLDLHFETMPDPGVWSGVVFLGPAGSPTAVEIPVTLYQGAAAKTTSAETVFPGDLVTFTITVDENPGDTVIWEVTDAIPAGFEFVAVEGATYMSATDSIYWSNAVHPWLAATTDLPLVSGSTDDGYGALGMPFDFPFFTETVTATSELKVGTNGYATFGADGTDFSNDCIPSTIDPNAFLAPFWDDQEIDGGDASQGMWYDVHGAPGDQILAVQWRIQDLGSTTQPNNFQAHLHENGDVWFLYDDMNEDSDGWGDSATIGLENRAEDDGTEYSCNTVSIHDDYAIHFTPNVSGTYDIAYAGSLASPFGNHTITLTLRAMAAGILTNTAYVDTGPNSCPVSDAVLVAGAMPTWEKEIWIGGMMYGPLDSPFTVVPGDEVTVVDRVSITGDPVVTYTLAEEWTDSLTFVDYDADIGTVSMGANSLDWLVEGGLADTWYAITKTFAVNGDAGWIDYLTETLTVENGPMPEVVVLEFDIPAMVTKSGPATASQGETITYTIVFETPDMLMGTAALTDVLPAGVTYADALTWTFGTAMYNAGDNAVYWTATGAPLPLDATEPQGFTGEALVDGLAAASEKPAAEPSDNIQDILWEQTTGGTNGIVSNYYTGESQGTYAADDFYVDTTSWDIDTIFVDGFINLGDLATNATALAWYIYADASGEPAGHPGDGTELWSYITTPADPAVSITGDAPTLDVVAATGSALNLPQGTYWLSFFPSINVVDPDEQDRFNWFIGSTTNLAFAKLYDDGHFGGLPWTDIATLVGDPNWHDQSFRLEGTAEILAPSVVTITFQVDVTADPGSMVTNDVMVDYNGTMLYDQHTFLVPGPSFYLTKTADLANPYPGELVTYTVVFGNEGSADALGVVVSDTLPAEVIFESADPAAVYDPVAHEVVWSGLNLMIDDAVTATLVVRIDPAVEPSTVLTNTAYLFYGDMPPVMGIAPTPIQPSPVTYYYLPMIYKNSTYP